MTIYIVILVVLTLAALWTVMTPSLLKSAIGLALTSAVLTVIMFRLHSPLAAVFELSVCAGLIRVVFISTINLTKALSKQEKLEYEKERLNRFWMLPLLVILVGAGLALVRVHWTIPLPPPEVEKDVRSLLWNTRSLDLLGQMVLLLAGVFGVVVLFKELRNK